jgi:hypothetical protein
VSVLFLTADMSFIEKWAHELCPAIVHLTATSSPSALRDNSNPKFYRRREHGRGRAPGPELNSNGLAHNPCSIFVFAKCENAARGGGIKKIAVVDLPVLSPGPNSCRKGAG